MFEFDVSKIIKLKEKNALAVEVFPPVLGEPSIGFVDWNPIPPDKSIGIIFRRTCYGKHYFLPDEQAGWETLSI